MAGIGAGVLSDEVGNAQVSNTCQPAGRHLHSLSGPVEGGAGREQRVNERAAGQLQRLTSIQLNTPTKLWGNERLNLELQSSQWNKLGMQLISGQRKGRISGQMCK